MAAAAPEASAAAPSAPAELAEDGQCGVENVARTEWSVPATEWPAEFERIPRVKFTSKEELVELISALAGKGEPVIIEGTNIINTESWADIEHVRRLIQDNTVIVKKSPNKKFRYYDLKKNAGNFTFTQPCEETRLTVDEFLSESQQVLREGLPQRMYLQETLSGHSEMAEEFVTWNWELLIKTSIACGWGLPDSNELFMGMPGCETPLHFDERENMFVQVRGEKEVVVFPFVDYSRLYPFPTTHPCDRQSMVGDPRTPDLDAFPRFQGAVGKSAVLRAGDLLYLPYGWWHWLRNLDHLTISVSFWSTTPPSDLSKGVPDVFSEHMLARVRRNLEGMVAQRNGPENHNATMLALRDSVAEKKEDDPVLAQVRQLLAAVKMPVEKQDIFLLEMIDGRFGVDWSRHV